MVVVLAAAAGSPIERPAVEGPGQHRGVGGACLRLAVLLCTHTDRLMVPGLHFI